MTPLSFPFDKDPVAQLRLNLTQFANAQVKWNSDLIDAY